MLQLLSEETYRTGFLVDDEWIGGVADHPAKQGVFLVFVLNHLTGEKIGTAEFSTFQAAVSMLTAFGRSWKFEKTGGCGGGGCGGKGGGCGGGGGGGCHRRGSDAEPDGDHKAETLSSPTN